MITQTQLLLLLEQVENFLPGYNKIIHYLDPLREFTKLQWSTLKVQMYDLILRIALGNVKIVDGKILSEKAEFVFPKDKQSITIVAINQMMRDMAGKVQSEVDTIKQTARMDAYPTLTKAGVTVTLTKQGLDDVVKALDTHTKFIDDMTHSFPLRIDALIKARYAGITQFKTKLNRSLRIDRDVLMKAFSAEVKGITQSMMDGSLSTAQWRESMQGSIQKHYTELYKGGVGRSTLQQEEQQFIRNQANSQIKYLNNFGGYIDGKRAMGDELTKKVLSRAELYAQRGSSLFEAGYIGSLPDDVLVDWLMSPAEHCRTCPIIQGNNPYTKKTLPGMPGEGFHFTECGTNCQCYIEVAEEYAQFWAETPTNEIPFNFVTIPTQAINRFPKAVLEMYPEKTGIINTHRIKDEISGGYKYQAFKMGDTEVYRRVSRDSPMLDGVEDALNYIPAEDRDLVKQIFVLKEEAVDQALSHLDDSLGIIYMFEDTMADKEGVGLLLSKIGQLKAQQLTTIKPDDILSLGNLPKRIITNKNYGNYTRAKRMDKAFVTDMNLTHNSLSLSEELGNVYSEYMLTGKVTNVVGEEFIETTSWAQKLFNRNSDIVASKWAVFGKNKYSDLMQRILKGADTVAPVVQAGGIKVAINGQVKSNGTYDKAEDVRKELIMLFKSESKVTQEDMDKTIEISKKMRGIADMIEFNSLRIERQKLVDAYNYNKEEFLEKARELLRVSDKRKVIKITQMNTLSKKHEGQIKEFTRWFGSDVVTGRWEVTVSEATGIRASMGKFMKLAPRDDAAFHEMGHWFEQKCDDKMRMKIKLFLAKRTAGENPVKLKTITGVGYGDDEICRKDKFLDPYMGKIYADGETEIMSMGIDMMYSDPVKFATEDPDMFNFIYDAIRGIK